MYLEYITAIQISKKMTKYSVMKWARNHLTKHLTKEEI